MWRFVRALHEIGSFGFIASDTLDKHNLERPCYRVQKHAANGVFGKISGGSFLNLKCNIFLGQMGL